MLEFLIDSVYKIRRVLSKGMAVVSTMAKQNRIKGQTKIYKTLHRKLKINQETH
jgi:hypothetical protein